MQCLYAVCRNAHQPTIAINPLESTDSTPHQPSSPVTICAVTPGLTPS